MEFLDCITYRKDTEVEEGNLAHAGKRFNDEMKLFPSGERENIPYIGSLSSVKDKN